jgi:predicted nucleic acid-binding protein
MRQIIVDTNLLILMVVGLTDRALIRKHKRTKQFEEEDYDLLMEVLSNFDQILTTPHILTETSNLAAQTHEDALLAVRAKLRALFDEQQEDFAPSISIAKNPLFVRLGLTDCAILSLVKNKIPLLTVDHDLYLAAAGISDLVVNFNHVRQERLIAP